MIPTSRKAKILVTGATGQIGSELVLELRKRYGGESVVAVGHSRKPETTLLNSGPYESFDATDRLRWDESTTKHDIDTVYHLAALLSAKGEQTPQLAWKVNMDSLYHVLEIAKEQQLRVFWPSSIAVFGSNTPRQNTPQDTVLVPTTMYGVTKVAGELLCNYYFTKYSVDVRSVRYPGIVSSETPPGGGTTDYAVEIFYEAIKHKRYTCFVKRDTILPMMYMPDCLKATIDLMEADSSMIKCRTSYNIAGISFSAGELASEIKKYIHDFECDYKADFRQKIADSWPMTIDDTVARREWGWKPEYTLRTMTRDMIERLSLRLSEGRL